MHTSNITGVRKMMHELRGFCKFFLPDMGAWCVTVMLQKTVMSCNGVGEADNPVPKGEI